MLGDGGDGDGGDVHMLQPPTLGEMLQILELKCFGHINKDAVILRIQRLERELKTQSHTFDTSQCLEKRIWNIHHYMTAQGIN